MNRYKALADLIAQFAPEDGIHAMPVPRLSLVRMSRPTEPLHSVQNPGICIVVQGSKQVIVGDRVLRYGAGNQFIISVDVPVTGQVTEASADEPYLCLKLNLDPGIIGALLLEMGPRRFEPSMQPCYCVSTTTDGVLDAASRLVGLLATPEDIPVLAPMIEREILYRLLQGEQASRLVEIATGESRVLQVNRAIGWIRRNFATAFAIEEVAAEASMSTSALHQHFKDVTGLSPLQYQKQLRLQEARRLILSQSLDAAAAGFQVGYNSPSQFSREYNRLFGAPPLKDVQRLRATPELYAEA